MASDSDAFNAALGGLTNDQFQTVLNTYNNIRDHNFHNTDLTANQRILADAASMIGLVGKYRLSPPQGPGENAADYITRVNRPTDGRLVGQLALYTEEARRQIIPKAQNDNTLNVYDIGNPYEDGNRSVGKILDGMFSQGSPPSSAALEAAYLRAGNVAGRH